MGIRHLSDLVADAQGSSYLSCAALLQVSLEQETLHLAALAVLLRLNLMKGKLSSTARR